MQFKISILSFLTKLISRYLQYTVVCKLKVLYCHFLLCFVFLQQVLLTKHHNKKSTLPILGLLTRTYFVSSVGDPDRN